MRSALEAALIACAYSPLKAKARRFLRGLSCDELQYIAGFLGSCILESASPAQAGGFDLPHSSEDRELKMILVKEYLSHGGITRRAD